MNVKKLLSTLLALAMVLTMLPVNVLAEDPVRPGATKNADITWSRTVESSGTVLKNQSTRVWNWDTVKNLTTSETRKVWDGMTDPYCDEYLEDKIDDDSDGALHSSATWERFSTRGRSDIRRFKGTFKIPAGYDVSDYVTLASSGTKYGELGNIIPINDNIYIFIYPEGTQVTNSNYLDYLAFWTGTSNQDGITSFHDIPGTSAFKYPEPEKPSKPSFLAGPSKWKRYKEKLAIYNQKKIIYNELCHTQGWYAQATDKNVGAMMLSQDPYADNNTQFVIDMFVEDTAGDGGGMDQINLMFKKVETNKTVAIKYYKDDIVDDNAHLLGQVSLKGKKIGDSITLPLGTGKGQLNYLKPTGDYKDGVQTDPIPFIVGAGSNEIKVLYTKTTYPVKVEYYDFDDKSVISEELSGYAPAGLLTGTSSITDAQNQLVPVKKDIPNYKYKESADITVSNGGSNILKLYYSKKVYEVKFEVIDDNTTLIEPQNIKHGGTASRPLDPPKDGYTLDGWYTVKSASNELSSKFVFTALITMPTTLYAQWKPKEVTEGTATIEKLDIDGTSLAGASFTVNGTSVSPKSSSTHVFDMPKLVYGTEYTVSEETVPIGYTGVPSFKVKLNAAANGFEFVTSPSPANVTLSGLKITVKNAKDDTQTKNLSYTVNYYKDNNIVSGDDVTITKDVWVNSTVLPVAAGDFSTASDKYTGYRFDHTDPAIIPDSIAGDGVINVYYVEDGNQTKKLSYTVDYYKDGSIVSGDTVTVTKDVWVNSTVLPVAAGDFSTASGKYTGYKFVRTDPTAIPATIADKG
ncbi:InlB B-repeat-containing protein, partial [Oscillospiraceae bacterium PP1C4]